jgi:hypothetical protein
MGSTFNENQIFAARGAEARGYGTMQENMQRMSTLASAGVNNPQASLASVMEVALTKGLDSSKALNAVAEHTAALVSSSTGRAFGIESTGAAASLLTAGITDKTPNREAELERVASLQQVFSSVGTNAGTNYAGMVNIARISKTTGLGGVSAVLASQIDDATLMSMGGANAGQQLQSMGIDVKGKDANQVLSKLKRDRQLQLLDTGNFAVNFNKEDVLKRWQSGQDLTDSEQRGVAQSAGLLSMRTGQRVTPEDLKNRVMGITTAVNPNAPKGTEALTMPGADDKSMRTSLDKLRTMGFEQLTTAAQTAATNLGGAAKAINTLTSAFEGLEKAMPNIEKSATTAAGRAATGEKGLDVNGFNVAIDKLGRVLDRALNRSGLSVGSDSRQRTTAPGP